MGGPLDHGEDEEDEHADADIDCTATRTTGQNVLEGSLAGKNIEGRLEQPAIQPDNPTEVQWTEARDEEMVSISAVSSKHVLRCFTLPFTLP
jgi:hypothetical protein